MHLGIMRIALRLPQSRSLKTRRQTASSLTGRIRARFNVSASQDATADGEAWQSLTITVAAVASAPAGAEAMLTEVADYIAATRPDLELLYCETEIISGV